jgi:hypothetical protein
MGHVGEGKEEEEQEFLTMCSQCSVFKSVVGSSQWVFGGAGLVRDIVALP